MIRKYFSKKELFGENEFNWRGGEVSRLESLVDAVFAIAVTLLIVSRDVPKTFDEFLTVMWSFVGFAVTFSFLFMIWKEHYLFHRRFGLEDRTTIFLNSVLIFLILFYIYPLKFLAEVLIGEMVLNFMFGMKINFGFSGNIDMRQLMLIYSSGVWMIWMVIRTLYQHALNHKQILELDKQEVSTTVIQIMIYNIMIFYATVSILIASFANSGFSIAMSGWIYSGIGPTIFIYLKLKK
tara:strand:+ start:359 stop:1069 length:711 start_codon:yes stop_codon:yes gene_type:complete